jgi:hypothetical protein
VICDGFRRKKSRNSPELRSCTEWVKRTQGESLAAFLRYTSKSEAWNSLSVYARTVCGGFERGVNLK